MQFANINTGEIREVLSSTIIKDGQVIQGATIQEWAELGWRRVVEVETPAEGFRVGSYNVVAIDGLTCRLTIATAINIADELAAIAAAEAAENKTAAKQILDVASSDMSRAIRAFAELTLEQINTLRTREGLAAVTWAQFLAAMKSKIDAQ